MIKLVLETNDIINGTLALIFVGISVIVGLIFFVKYRTYKQKTLVYVGLTWIVMSEPWMGHTISFLFALFTGNGLSIQAIYFISTTFVPIGLTAWLAAFRNFLNIDKKKIIIIVSIISQAVFEVVFLYLLFTNPSMIAIERSATDSINQPFILAYFLVVLAIFLITGIIFAMKAIKSDKVDIKLKGKILFMAIIFYVVGAVWDGVFVSEGSLLIVSRIVLALSAVLFYYGFVLPNWLKRIFIKESKA